jgi:hypothetical protein
VSISGTKLQRVAFLRAYNWATIPHGPGVYRWYFPPEAIHQLKIDEYAPVYLLKFRTAPHGHVCLYHGMANSLAQRIQWHAAQRLARSSMASGFLSTFRFTLLALNEFDYWQDEEKLNAYFDQLWVDWQPAESRPHALELEHQEFRSGFHYPLNIQGNPAPELAAYLKFVKQTRKSYKILTLGQNHE